jgi:peptide/nickel transport system permease protein
MIAVVLRRLLRSIATLLLSSFVVFAALFVAPGSPLAFLTGGRPLPAQQIAQLEAQYHLNRPFLDAYWHWLGQVLHGNFGTSIIFHTSVSSLLGARAGTTIFLVAYAGILTVVFGLTLGAIAGVRGGRTDGTITVLTTVGLATPSFVLAIILIALFAVGTGWFPVFGQGSGFFDRVWHLTLPSISLAIGGVAYLAQTTRTAVRGELHAEHTETARSRGLPERVVIRRHVLRNSMIPIATVGGLTVAGLVAGVAVVETAFGLQGIGSYLIQSTSQKDFPVVQAICLILVTIFIVTNILVDGICYMVDPRLRARR